MGNYETVVTGGKTKVPGGERPRYLLEFRG